MVITAICEGVRKGPGGRVSPSPSLQRHIRPKHDPPAWCGGHRHLLMCSASGGTAGLVCEGTPGLNHTMWPCLSVRGHQGCHTPHSCAWSVRGHWLSMEPFLAAFEEFYSPAATNPVHFLPPRKEGGLPCVVLGVERGGNGHHRDGLLPPSRATGPSCRASSSLGAPGQLLSMPPGCPVQAEKRQRVVQSQIAKGERCRKPSGAG